MTGPVPSQIQCHREPETQTMENPEDGPSTILDSRLKEKRIQDFSPINIFLKSSVHNQFRTQTLPHLSSAAGAEDPVGSPEQTPG